MIKAVAKLRTKRGRQLQNRIVIDGRREVRRALDNDVQLDAIYVPIENVAEWDDAPCELVTVSERAFNKITFGDRHEVVAVGPTPNHSLDDLTLGAAATIAVLEHLEKPGNIGAILRSADGAGLNAVVLVDPVTDLYNPNAIRASLGTIFSIPLATTSFVDYQAWAKANQFRHVLSQCDSNAVPYSVADYEPPCAVVLGSEASGIPERWQTVEHCTNVTIPMRGIADSLNVASTAAILFYKAMERYEG